MAQRRTIMEVEARQASAAAAWQIDQCAAQFKELGQRLRRTPPRFVITGARGSSDHAATYGKYLIETHLGLPVASIGPSVASLYRTPLRAEEALFITVSRSGRGTDLLHLVESARKGGALTVAFVGDDRSPLAQAVDVAIPLCDEAETNVTATKSYIASLLAFLQLVAHWGRNKELLRHIDGVPAWLDQAAGLDWYPALSALVRAHGLYVIARGIGTGAALEVAQKCQETCRLHANAYSAAELLHGPLAVIGPGFPVLALTQADATIASTRETIRNMIHLGADVLTTDTEVQGAIILPTVARLPPEVAPLALMQSFYLGIHRVATDRGLNPDLPLNLQRVADTL